MSGDNYNDSREQPRNQTRDYPQDRDRSNNRTQGNFERPVHAPREAGTRFPKNRPAQTQERAQHPLDGESLAGPKQGNAGPRGGRNFRGTPGGPVGKRAGYKGKSSNRPGPR